MSETSFQYSNQPNIPIPLRVGIDMIEIARIQTALMRYGPRFLDRIYTENEKVEFQNKIISLAGRFAVKEACSKALGTGIDGLQSIDIECLRSPAGKPYLVLRGAADSLARAQGWVYADVSISSSKEFCVATVVAYCGPTALPQM